MSNKLHIQMHGDHQHWLSESDFWREDTAQWRTEIEQSLRDVERLNEALRAHAAALHAHLEMICSHAQKIRAHEHALAGFEQGDGGDELIGFAKDHEKERAEQVATRQVHERLKKFHHGLIAQLNLLIKSVSKAV